MTSPYLENTPRSLQEVFTEKYNNAKKSAEVERVKFLERFAERWDLEVPGRNNESNTKQV